MMLRTGMILVSFAVILLGVLAIFLAAKFISYWTLIISVPFYLGMALVIIDLIIDEITDS